MKYDLQWIILKNPHPVMMMIRYHPYYFIFYVKMILKSLGKNNHGCQLVWWMMLCEKKTKNTNQKKNQNKIQLAKNRLPSVIY